MTTAPSANAATASGRGLLAAPESACLVFDALTSLRFIESRLELDVTTFHLSSITYLASIHLIKATTPFLIAGLLHRHGRLELTWELIASVYRSYGHRAGQL